MQPVASAAGVIKSAMGVLLRKKKEGISDCDDILKDYKYLNNSLGLESEDSSQQKQEGGEWSMEHGNAVTSTNVNGKFAVNYPVDSKDVGTPDAWVPRHPELIRLTGRHPFNCEPSPAMLVEAGFLTPASIHYVRNHGAVPTIKWEEHRITVDVNGSVKKTFTMNNIVNMPSQRIPVTLVCAGNRRKEENMCKQTVGFNWGPCGVGTSLLTGVPMHVFLKQCGITAVSENCQHLLFQGPDGELPKGDDGSYGTSIPLSMALDPAADVMIAYEQNGEKLAPDHGYPVRIIIPGWIGGRMVKFLQKITVCKTPSLNFYHFNDNQIMPSHVDSEQANAEDWWHKGEYLFNQLNIQSTILYPDQGSVVKHVEAAPVMLPIGGYAFTGGGRKITRVEFSLDGGINWRRTELTCPEKTTKYGKHWCWIFWKVEISSKDLAASRQICCRAWDEGNNTQPKDLTWNVMGMGNNCWFRVKIHKKTLPNDNTVYLEFEAPTQAGTLKGGWMGNAPGGWKSKQEHMKPVHKKSMENGNSTAQIKAAPLAAPSTGIYDGILPSVAEVTEAPTEVKEARKAGGGKQISMAEVEKHATEQDCWIVVKDMVYDVTKYLDSHPGGGDSILINGGMDSTEDFEAIHSQKAWGLLDEYYIGDLAQ